MNPSTNFSSVLYQDYPIAESGVPNVIMAFNPGFHAYDTWTSALDIILEMNVPFVVTVRNPIEVDKELKFLDTVNANVVLKPRPNPFRSLFPALTLTTEDIIELNNQFFLVVQGHNNNN